jgi:hypothetical protein
MRSAPMRMTWTSAIVRLPRRSSNEEGNDHGDNDHEEGGDEDATQDDCNDKLYAMGF